MSGCQVITLPLKSSGVGLLAGVLGDITCGVIGGISGYSLSSSDDNTNINIVKNKLEQKENLYNEKTNIRLNPVTTSQRVFDNIYEKLLDKSYKNSNKLSLNKVNGYKSLKVKVMPTKLEEILEVKSNIKDEKYIIKESVNNKEDLELIINNQGNISKKDISKFSIYTKETNSNTQEQLYYITINKDSYIFNKNGKVYNRSILNIKKDQEFYIDGFVHLKRYIGDIEHKSINNNKIDLYYEIVSGNNHDVFTIDEKGRVKVLSTYNLKQNYKYTLGVRVVLGDIYSDIINININTQDVYKIQSKDISIKIGENSTTYILSGDSNIKFESNDKSIFQVKSTQIVENEKCIQSNLELTSSNMICHEINIEATKDNSRLENKNIANLNIYSNDNIWYASSKIQVKELPILKIPQRIILRKVIQDNGSIVYEGEFISTLCSKYKSGLDGYNIKVSSKNDSYTINSTILDINDPRLKGEQFTKGCKYTAVKIQTSKNDDGKGSVNSDDTDVYIEINHNNSQNNSIHVERRDHNQSESFIESIPFEVNITQFIMSDNKELKAFYSEDINDVKFYITSSDNVSVFINV